VREPHRRQGVGQALMYALAAEAVRRGVQLVDWRTEAASPEAVTFYDRLGAERMGSKLTYLLRAGALKRMARRAP